MGKKIMITIIVVLTLLVLTLSGFIIYDKVINKERPQEKVEPKKEDTIEINENLDSVAQILVDKLDKYFIDYYDENQNIDFSNATDEELIKGAYAYASDYKLTKTIVDDYYKSLFGRKLSNYPDLNCWAGDGVIYKYNTEKEEYEMQGTHGHGGLCTVHSSIIKYSDIEKKDDNYVITVTKVYAPADGMCSSTPENAFYADSKYTVKIDKLNEYAKTDDNGNWDKADIIGAKKYYEQNYDNFKSLKPQYKYTFKKDKNNYYLVSYEIVK